MAFWKAVIAVCAAAPLAACNMVVSEKPWFTQGSGPQLKDGLWVSLAGDDCAFDPAKTVAEWPECASPMLVRAGKYSGPPIGSDEQPPSARSDTAKWDSLDHVLVDGAPQIDQLRFKPAEAGDKDSRPGVNPQKGGYIYLALVATARDGDGRITQTQRWPVLCGPPPVKQPRKNGVPIFATDRPFKGLTMDGGACLARDVKSLRAAALQSEKLAAKAGFHIVTSKWVSDQVR